MRRKLIAGNWKMNCLKEDGLKLAAGLADAAKSQALKCDLLICPPFTLTALAQQEIADSPVALGAQDCHAKVSGAHTGDISAAMLKDLGCKFVILGHSERRTDHKETSATVKAKAEAALNQGLIAIVCVGETEGERDQNKTLEVVGAQVRESLPAGANADNTVIAYEPVWAIGTGRTPTLAEVAEVHAFIRAEAGKILAAADLKILYGGSMKPSNAKDLLAIADVDGGLIGGAALKVEDFLGIAGACP